MELLIILALCAAIFYEGKKEIIVMVDNKEVIHHVCLRILGFPDYTLDSGQHGMWTIEKQGSGKVVIHLKKLDGFTSARLYIDGVPYEIK